ncbi:HPF/RaiA family ribosome-associated protein [bacterium]|nr:HPF/RaiA family ribosome-associated protein [bacterium]
MDIRVNTDNHIKGSADLEETLSATTRKKLGKFSSSITTVEIHLRDENSTKGGEFDKHCSIELRLEGESPSAVTHKAETVKESFQGALTKAERVIRDTIEKRRSHH